MRLTHISAVALTAIGGFLLLFGTPADAQKRQREDFFYYSAQEREMRYRTRTRVTVERRSYLDPGPELLPGEYKYRDYAEPYGYSALTDAVPNQTWNRNPFNGPFDVPGRRWPGAF